MWDHTTPAQRKISLLRLALCQRFTTPDSSFNDVTSITVRISPQRRGSLARGPWPSRPHWCSQWLAQTPPLSASASGGRSPTTSGVCQWVCSVCAGMCGVCGVSLKHVRDYKNQSPLSVRTKKLMAHACILLKKSGSTPYKHRNTETHCSN